MLRTSILAALAMLLSCLPVQAGFISSVVKTGGNGSCGADGCPKIDWDVLNTTNLARNDRSHTLIDIPSELMEDNIIEPSERAEMIQFSNSDKSSADVEHQVTLSRLSALYVGIDNRQFGGAGGVSLQTSQYSWMSDTSFTGLPSGFINTGRVIGVDENNDGTANQYFTLFATLAPAGTYTLGAHEDTGGVAGPGNNNMYIAIADDHVLAVPEPAGVALAVFGLVSLVALRRKR